MPRYDYKCKKCNIIEEKEHRILETPVIRCSKCNSKMFIIITINPTVIWIDNPYDPSGVTWEDKHEKWLRSGEAIRVKEKKKRIADKTEESFYGGCAKDMIKKGVVK